MSGDVEVDARLSAGQPHADQKDLAARLLELEPRYTCKKRLAVILNGAAARRRIEALATGAEASAGLWASSPLGRPTLRSLWQEATEVTEALLQLERAELREACHRWAGGGRAAEYVADLFTGPDGALTLGDQEAAFFAERSACVAQPTSARIQSLAQQTPAFVAALAGEVALFRRGLHELRATARAPLEMRTYGWGEISRTVGLKRRGPRLVEALEPAPVVYKRLAPFPSWEAAEIYARTYREYNRRLREEVGITVPDFDCKLIRDRRGRPVALPMQARLDPGSIGKDLLLKRDAEQGRILFRMVLEEYRKLARYNRARASEDFRIGLDGQIPNWAVRDYRGEDVPLRGDEGLIFVDTNTPMMRTRGEECLPMSFYLQALPSLLRPLARPMAKGVLNRYFSLRTILLDFLANTSIHGRPELVELFLPDGNAFLAEGLIEPTPRPITPADVDRYIKDDIATWRLTRSLRKVEEMLQGQRGPIATARAIHRIYTQPIF